MHPSLDYDLVHERRDLLFKAKSQKHALQIMTYPATQQKQKTGGIISVESGQKLPYLTYESAITIINQFARLFPNFYLIHIVRDPIGAINSQLKTFKRDFDQCVKNYFSSVPRVSRHINTMSNALSLEYHNIIENPIETLNMVYTWIGGDIEDWFVKKVANTKHFWEYNGRVMPGLRYFDSIKPTHSEIVLTDHQIKLIRKMET